MPNKLEHERKVHSVFYWNCIFATQQSVIFVVFTVWTGSVSTQNRTSGTLKAIWQSLKWATRNACKLGARKLCGWHARETCIYACMHMRSCTYNSCAATWLQYIVFAHVPIIMRKLCGKRGWHIWNTHVIDVSVAQSKKSGEGGQKQKINLVVVLYDYGDEKQKLSPN